MTSIGLVRQIDLRELKDRLLGFDIENTQLHPTLNPVECLSVCHMAMEAMKTSEICIHIKTPINIVGDLHGQFHDLLRIFDALGQPPDSRFLFLGDYVDRGKYSLEVMTLLFVLMLLYPDSVYLLRGNHETANICCRYGFKDEIGVRFAKAHANKVLSAFLRAFMWMPLCAIIDGEIFCCHGGISPSFMLPPFSPKGGQAANVQALNEFKKPVEPFRPSLLCDLLWSDPFIPNNAVTFGVEDAVSKEAKWAPSQRGCSYVFSGAALDDFLHLLGSRMLVRGHQMVQNGYQAQLNRRCLTVFSAPGYSGVYNNTSSVLQFAERITDTAKSLGCFFLLRPVPRDADTAERLFWTELKSD